MSQMISIKQFSEELSAIPEQQFTRENLLRFLQSRKIELSSLNPYFYFSSEHYTRNLIQKTKLFELLAICWDIGQKSPIHNHRDQSCWMAMACGSLHVHNYVVVNKDSKAGFCELKSGGQFVLDPDSPNEVDPAEPIHQVLNLASFGKRAVSLHIYSLPFDTCEVYDLKEKRYEDVPLVNTTEYGVLCPDVQFKVEKITLG